MKQIIIFMILLVSFTIAQKRTMLDVNNSSATVLDSAATYTGYITNAISSGRWSSLAVSAYANHSSGVDGTLTIRFGTDGTNWTSSTSYTIATDTEAQAVVFPLTSRYYQVLFVNGAELQTEFRLETILFEEDMSVGDALGASLVIQTDVYDSSLGANDVIVLNAEQYHYTAPVTKSTTNLSTDSTAHVFSLQSYPFFTAHVLASGGVEYEAWVTNIAAADDTDPHDGNWINYSTVLLGSTSITDADGFYIQDNRLPALKIMFWIVTSDASNDFSVTMIKSGG